MPHSVVAQAGAGSPPTVQNIVVPSRRSVATPIRCTWCCHLGTRANRDSVTRSCTSCLGSLESPPQFLNVGQVANAAATLVAAGQMKPVILVMPSGSRSFLADEEWVSGISKGNAWETFVARDLVTAIDARHRTIASVSRRGIAGLSEGGYGALNIGLHNPGEFRPAGELVRAGLARWPGPRVADALPLDELPGRDCVPLVVCVAAFAVAGLLA